MVRNSGNTVIIGIGNGLRADDGAGLYIAHGLRSYLNSNIRIIAGVGDGTDLINAWDGIDVAIVIDCVRAKGEPGRIYRFNGLKDDIQEDLFAGFSTHAFSIPETIKLAMKVDRLPRVLIVYGVEGADFSAGEGLSDEVKKAAEEVMTKIRKEIESNSLTASMAP